MTKIIKLHPKFDTLEEIIADREKWRRYARHKVKLLRLNQKILVLGTDERPPEQK